MCSKTQQCADLKIIIMEQRKTIETFDAMIIELERQNFLLTASACPLDLAVKDDRGIVRCMRRT